MTGVLLAGVVVSLLLHETKRQHNARSSKHRDLRLIFILISLSLFVWNRLTGNAILTFNPPAQIDKLTPLGTEGTKRIIFPLD